jgi:energy-coupling factor transporter ATP-binding protein EcfA2
MEQEQQNSPAIQQIAYSMDDCFDNLFKMRHAGLKRGAWTGFKVLDELYTVKKGSMTYLVAPSHCGKTSFLNELMTNLIEFSKWKIVIYSPETGTPSDVFNELLWTRCKKPFVCNKKGYNATEDEAKEAIEFLKDNIRILDFGLQLPTIDMIYSQVARLKEEGFNADMLVIDPAVEVKTGKSQGMRDDIAIEELTNKIRRFSSHYDIHTLIAIHTRQMEKKKGKLVSGEEVWYMPAPTMNDIQSGLTWARKGMMILTLWRPPAGLPKGDTGDCYVDNEMVISVVKARPKLAGALGQCSLFFDKWANRFYESWEQGKPKQWAYDCPEGFQEREISPNNEYAILKQKQEKIKQEVIW